MASHLRRVSGIGARCAITTLSSCAIVLLMAVRVSANILTVNTLTDDNTGGNGLVSLREAISAANNSTTDDLGDTGTGNDTIVFSASLFSGSPGTISMNFGVAGYNQTGAVTDWFGPSALRITSTIKIVGPTGLGPSGTNGLTITAAQSGSANTVGTTQRIFTVTSAGNLELDNVTLSGGKAVGGAGSRVTGASSGSGGALGAGGAIFSDGTLTLNNDTFTNNSATGGAGLSSSLSGSHAGSGGGGMGADATTSSSGAGPNGGVPKSGPGLGGGGVGGGGGGASAAGKSGASGGFGGGGGASSTSAGQVGGNAEFGGGGGQGDGVGTGGAAVFGGGNATGSASGSGAGLGGAIFNLGGTLSITNSTFSSNTATGGSGGVAGSGFGGAIFNADGTLSIVNSTLSSNTAAQGATDLYVFSGSIVINANTGGTLASTSATVKLLNDILGQNGNSFTDYDATANNAITTTGSFTNLIRNNGGTTPFPSGAVYSNNDPLLTGPTDTDGPTAYFTPGPLSDAIAHGTLAGAPATDQRGETRGTTIDIGSIQVTTSAGPTVPEPSTLTLAAIGLLGLGLLVLRRRSGG